MGAFGCRRDARERFSRSYFGLLSGAALAIAMGLMMATRCARLRRASDRH
jgi:hypothetical protein